jgi:hypothetical protein
MAENSETVRGRRGRRRRGRRRRFGFPRRGATLSHLVKSKRRQREFYFLIISDLEHTKLKLTVPMLLGGPQNTLKSKLVCTILFCLAPFSVFSGRMSAPYFNNPYIEVR